MKNKNDAFIALIILILAPIYLFKLHVIPVNVTGDESIFLENIYRIIYAPWVSPLELLGDKSMPALNFYWVVLWVKYLGIDNSVFALRFATVIFALITCITFYLLLIKHVTKEVALLSTLLLGTNVLFLNFARSGWNNMWVLCFGLLLIYFIENGLRESKKIFFVLAGFFASLCFYTYMAGKIFILAIFLYIFFYILFSKEKKKNLFHLLIFLFTFSVLIFPLAIVILQNKDIYFLRSATVSIFDNLGPEALPGVLLNQTIDNIKGLFLLDGSVIGKGIENLRYHPNKTSIVDPIVRISFFLGIILFYKYQLKLIAWWMIYLLIIIFLGIFTVDSPNLARSLGVLPFIYLQAALFWNKLYSYIPKKISFFVFSLCSALIIIVNINNYFKWAVEPETSQARRPATEYSDFKAEQEYKIRQYKNMR